MEENKNEKIQPGTWAAWRAQNEGGQTFGPSGENGFVFVDETKESFRGEDHKRKRTGRG